MKSIRFRPVRWLGRVGRAAIAQVLTLAGVRREVGASLAVELAQGRRTLTLVTIASVVAPLFELAFIALLYAIISPEQKAAFVSWLEQWGFTGAAVLSDDLSLTIAIAAVALVLLAAMLACRGLSVLVLTRYRFTVYLQYSARLISSYLEAPTSVAIGIDRNKIANAVLHEAELFGKTVFSLLSLASNAVAILFFIVSAGVVSPPLMGLSLLVGGVALVSVKRGYKRQQAVGFTRVKVQAELVGYVLDLLSGYRIVKIDGAERRVVSRAREFIGANQIYRIAKSRNEVFITLTSQAVIYLALLATVALAATILSIDAAAILVFLVIMSRLQTYVMALQGFWVEIQLATGGLHAVYDLLAVAAAGPPIDRKEVVVPRDSLPVLADVSFAYPGGPWVLREVSFETRPGDRILIQGPSGQGKTTLVHLIAGLLEPGRGEVRYGGHRLDDAMFRQIRHRLSYAAPDLHVFRDSIRENLCLAGEYTDAEIETAVDKAKLGKVVATMPGGLDGFLGENGSQLSLGERQRVMLAKIFLKKPDVILLDEAATNLDVDLERDILIDLLANMPRRAVLIMVTHRRPAAIRFTREFQLRDGLLREVPTAATAVSG